ncbi:MAG: NAD(P)H-dependent oxidoreductase [Pseudomonadota bacterium]
MSDAPNDTVLLVEASARKSGSTSRELARRLLGRLVPKRIISRDVADGLPIVTGDWVNANFTLPENRSAHHRQVLELSDSLVEELRAADTIVIATPIYNFSVPAALKSWIDLVARAGLTFRYTENGPVGLLEGKKAYVIVTSGGTPVRSDIDFASGYLKHVLGFIGIHDVEIIAADRLVPAPENAEAARVSIDAISAHTLAA